MSGVTIDHIEEVEFLTFFDIPEAYQSDFDWDEEQTGTYFIYRGNWYSLDEFMSQPCTHEGVDAAGNPIQFEADGSAGHGFFHATLIKLNPSGDGATVASHYC